jgi:hypothetical protein
MISRRHSLTRVRDSAHELAIAATHVPSLFTRTRLKDGHAHQLDAGDLAAVLVDARRRFDIPTHWEVGELVPTVSDVAVLQVGPPNLPFEAFLKLARSPAAVEGLRAQSHTLLHLHRRPELRDWRHVLPRSIADGEVDGDSYIFESALSGVPVIQLVGSKSWSPALHDAVAAVRRLHDVDGSVRRVDDRLFSQWVDPALQTAAELPTSWSQKRHWRLIELLRRRLRDGLVGRNVWVSRTHGDYSPNNVLADVTSGRITGILDWDRSLPAQPAFLDIAQFAIGAEHVATRSHLGAIVRDIGASEASAAPSEALALLDDFWSDHPGDRIDISVVALMTLLRHVQSNIDKAPRYASHRLWIYRTIETALSRLEG